MLNSPTIVEKRKTGELLAAKVVGYYIQTSFMRSHPNLSIGESSKAPEAHHALLGKQTYS